MKNIFINGFNAKSGGGKSILNNLLKLLPSQYNYFVLTPNKKDYLYYENDFIKIVEINKIYKKQMLFPIVYEIILPKFIKLLNVDIVFNLADIPIATKKKQVFLFDWPYAVYPESKVWQIMDFKSLLVRKVKLYLFKKNLIYIDKMIAQTEAMKNRLEKVYNLKDIDVVANAVSLENLDGGEYKDFNLIDGIKLLYLTVYYPHKNLEIFIPLAKTIKEKKLDFKIIITISPNQHKKSKELLENIKKEKLENIIINIGPVEMKNVPSLYKQCDGLLMPTLLESFSGTYVEAMYHKKTIFTSNFDFAKVVCKDIAFYFNPFDENNILDTLIKAYKNDDLIKEKIKKGFELVNNMDTWEETTKKYLKIIEKEFQNE